MANRRTRAASTVTTVDPTPDTIVTDAPEAGVTDDTTTPDTIVTDDQGDDTTTTPEAADTIVTDDQGDDQGDPPAPEAADTIDPRVTFDAAYGAFLTGHGDAVDPTTGTIPPALSDPLTGAYRKLGTKRATVAADVTAYAMGVALDGSDMAALAAIRDASTVMASANAPVKASAPSVDPMVLAVRQVTALRTAEAYVVGCIADDGKRASVLAEAAAVMAGERPDYVVSWSEAGLPTGNRKRTASGAPRATSGERLPVGELATRIMAAIEAADGEPMTAAQLNRACERTGGAVANAAVKLAADGKLTQTTVDRDNGRTVTAWAAASA